MPVYEYRCARCSAVTSVLRRSISSADFPPACNSCGALETERALSVFATPKTEQQVLENYGTPPLGAGPDSYRDPRQIGRWVERQFADMGVDMPEQTRKMIDEAREGELPDPVKDL